MAIDYVSLHNHTYFSVGQAISKPAQIFSRVKELGQNSVGIADYDTMAAIWDSYKESKKAGVKLIPGCVFNFTNNINDGTPKLYNLVLLAKNATGYKNILALRKYGYDNYIVHMKKSVSRIDWKALRQHNEGVICLSADGNGMIPQYIMNDNLTAAEESLKKFKDIFGDNFALELQPHNLQRRVNAYTGYVDQRKINLALKHLSDKFNVKPVVTTFSHYINKEDHDTHDLQLAISSGQPVFSGQRLKFDKKEFYIRDAEEIYNHFARHKNMWGESFINSLFENSVKFAEECENPEWIDPKVLTGIKSQLPEFPIKGEHDYLDFLTWKQSYSDKGDLQDDALFYRYRSFKGLDEKISVGKIAAEDKESVIQDMMEEFDVLEMRSFSSYMLIVADMINWARANGIVVGPGRGSVGGSMTAYLNNIHLANPRKYGLIFARFLNKYKDAFPDVDTDYAPSGRDKLHDYIHRKYGKEYIAQVSNVITITPKVYAKDLVKAYQLGGDRKESVALGNNIADSIPEDLKTIEKALAEAPLFGEYAKQFPELSQHKLLNKLPRAWGTHAAGVVIGTSVLHECVPIRRDKDGNNCLEYEKERAEENGLVKIDTLGLANLDIIAETNRIIESVGKIAPPLDFDYEQFDQKTYDLISSGNTYCVFQLAGVAASVCKQIKPRNISDIAIVTALIRPSSKAIIPDFVKVRNGEQQMELMHPSLERALKGTLGFGLYEECLLYIAADVAGWNMHKADGLRKMTKDKGKNPEKIEKLRKDFIDDALANKNIDNVTSAKIWDEVVSVFGGYGFNIPHATLYSMISFHTAYLKAHFPLEFLLANLMSKVGSNAKSAKDDILKIKHEIKSLGAKIVSPDINTSDLTYKIVNDKTLMTGLDSLKYLTDDGIADILKKRPFKDFGDFMLRTSSKVTSRSIQSLAASGSLDRFGLDRKLIFLYCGDYRKKLTALRASLNKKLEKGKITAAEMEKELKDFVYPFPAEEPWPIHELYALEQEYLGEGVSGTLQQRFPKFFEQKFVNFSTLPSKMPYVHYSDDDKENKKANQHNIEHQGISNMRGVISDVFEFKVKNTESKIFGQIMARMIITDPYGNNISTIMFPDSWGRAKERVEKILSQGKDTIKPGIAISFNGTFQWENSETYSFILNDILSYKGSPQKPKNLKGKSVKIPRKNSKSIKTLTKEELLDSLEEEIAFDGGSPIDDPDDDNDDFVF